MNDRAKIIKMAQRRNEPAIIAAAVNCKVQKVYDVLKKARALGMDIPKFTRGPKQAPTTLVQVPRITAQRLTPEAELRGMSVENLIAALVTTVASDNLVGAVIGDIQHD
jgi:hypothetical protein